MSQDFNTTSKKPRRVTRAKRNQPVLVTSVANEQEALPVEETLMPDSEPITLIDTPPVPQRRMAGFFSTVGKEDTATGTKETDIAKARLARATRGKIAATSKAAAIEAAEEEKKPAVSKAGTPGIRSTKPRNSGMFKPRYIFGMIIYLVAADFLGAIERNILVNMGVERTLSTFNLFGKPFLVTPSGITFIASLIIILVVLVRLDFLPTSLNALGGTPAKRGTITKNANSRLSDGDGPRPLPPTMRQGVQGDDDDLYKAYRTNQRRDKKR